MNTMQRIIKGDINGYTSLLTSFRTLSTNPEQITQFFSNEDVIADFQTNFDKCGERLIKFMDFCYKFKDNVSEKSGTEIIGRQMVEVLVLLLDDNFDSLYTIETLSRMVIAGLRIGLLSPTTNLNKLAIRLGEKEGLIEAVVSNQAGCPKALELFRKGSVVKKSSACVQWACKLANLCSKCPGSRYHEIKIDVDKVHMLIRVCNDVRNAQRQHDLNSTKESRGIREPPVLLMRGLNRDDIKGRFKSTTGYFKFPDLPEDTIVALKNLNIDIPQSARYADIVLERIQTIEIPKLVCVLINTYPCRVCNELSIGRELSFNLLPNEDGRGGKGGVAEPPAEDGYFGSKIGLWKILLSAEALKDIQGQSLAGNIGILEGRLRRLASGDWKGGNLSNILGTPAQKKHLNSPLFKANGGKKLRIVWQIGVGQNENNVFQQHITIWRVVDRKDVPKAVEHVVMVQRSKTHLDSSSKYSRHPILDHSGIYVPSEFLSNLNSGARLDIPMNNDPATYLSESERQTLGFYNMFYEFTKPVMHSFLTKNLLAEFPFHTSPEELEVVKHDCTGTLILGRAGSGKTTVLVHKLLRNYIAQKSIIGQRPGRQILLTRSPFLARKLAIYTKRLVESQLSKMSSTRAGDDHQNFVLDHENEMFAKSLFNISEEDFPVVCTSDQLLQLLENTIQYSDTKWFHCGKFHKLSNPRMQAHRQYSRRAQVVDFTVFRSEYWTQFPTSLKGKHEPGLVFGEIMGIIKGFASTGDHFKPLSREEYLNLSHKRAPTFDYKQRNEIYRIFEAYERQKRHYGDKDGVDRVVSILELLKTSEKAQQAVGGIFEELYVDEVQDQRCLDIILLLRLIKNPRAIHFAGDTAQCISKDSTFRFADVTSLFYQRFIALSNATKERDLAHPVMFKLNINYRTHQGIVGLSSFVMKLLYAGFPQTVDRMDEERGSSSGPIPTLFVGLGVHALVTRHVGMLDINQNVADFGAEQVILVRDELMKTAVQREIGEEALVLTILESKGMEFEDVFLLDFFTSTPCQPGLFLLENIFEQDGPKQLANNALLCSELKHLYVAITRARNRLWIFESSPGPVKPIVRLLTEGKNRLNPLVEVFAKDHPKTEEMLQLIKPAASSDPKVHSKMGYQLLNCQLYKDARICFRKAKDEVGQKIAQANLYMEEGREERSKGDYKNFLNLFQKAVDLFFETSNAGNAAFCLEEMCKLEEAARAYKKIKRYEKAASLYLEASLFLEACECFDEIERYADAALALRQGEKFNHLVRYLASHRNRLDLKAVTGYIKLLTILYKNGRISSILEGLIVFDILRSDEERIDFYRKCRLTQKLSEFLFVKDKYRQGFQELFQEGYLQEALDAAFRYMNQCDDIQVSDVITAANYMRFNDILAISHGKNPNCLVAAGIQSTRVANMFEQWDVFQTSVQHFRGKWAMVFPTLENDLHREIFSLLIATKGMQLGVLNNATSFEDIEYVIHALSSAIDIWGRIQNEGQELPMSVAIFLGIFSPREKSELVVLAYSPFHQENSQMNMKVAKPRSLKWLFEKIHPLYDEVHQKAASYCEAWENAGKLCDGAVLASWCRAQNCAYSHTAPSSDECKKKIRHLRNMASLLCNFEIAVRRGRRNKVMIGQVGIRKRRWLELFLSEITFRNAFEHDAEAAVCEFTSIVSRSTKHSAILSGLEDLLFYRLSRTERNSGCDLSSMFEQVQLSQNLGNRVSERFRLHVVSGKQNLAIQSLRLMMRAFFYLKQNKVQIFCDNLLKGFNILEKLDGKNFNSFHAIVGIYEKLITFLFLIVCPVGCVFPMSWIKLHIADCADGHNYVQADHWQKEVYGECLVRTLFSFVTVIDRVSQTINRPSFEAGILERNRNVLVIALINLAATPIPLTWKNEFSHKCQGIFLSSKLAGISMEFTDDRSPQEMSMILKRSFDRYRGKDSLIIVTRNETKATNPPSVLDLLDQSGVKTLALQSLITATPVKIESDSDSHAINLGVAVIKIQAFWRKRQPYLISSRENLKTGRGKAIDLVFSQIIKAHQHRNCNTKSSRKWRISKNWVLLTWAVDFYVEFHDVRKRTLEVGELWERVTGNNRIRVEALQELLEGPYLMKLDECRSQLHDDGKISVAASVSEVGKLYGDPEAGCQDIQNHFWKLGNELSNISMRLDGVVEKLHTVSACTV